MRVVAIPAHQMSGNDFLKAHMPQPSPLDVLVGKLWTTPLGDREAIREIHAQIKALNNQSPYERVSWDISEDGKEGKFAA